MYERNLFQYYILLSEIGLINWSIYSFSHTQELREDNSALCECKERLEEQNTTSQSELTGMRTEMDRLQGVLDTINKVSSVY